MDTDQCRLSSDLLRMGLLNEKTEQLTCDRLIFDASFESGNLDRVRAINSAEYDLFIRPDSNNLQYRVWFHFAVENVISNRVPNAIIVICDRFGVKRSNNMNRVLFNVVNFSKVRSLFSNGFAAPVFLAPNQQSWYGFIDVHYERSSQHENQLILRFSLFLLSTGRYEFAYSFPYSYRRLRCFLAGLVAKNLPFFHRHLIGTTVQKRRLDLLTIGDNTVEMWKKPRKIVVISARVHPGESPSSIVCQGLINFLISSDPRAEQLRNKYLFKIVPMLNPDGVYLGNYRCSATGFDLNRSWNLPSILAHPTIDAVKKLLLQFNSDPNTSLVMHLDLHAHSQLTNSFIFGNVFAHDSERCTRQLVLPYLLAQLCDDFSLNHTQFNTDDGKAGTSRRTMGDILNVDCLCYTLEVSFFSYRPNDDSQADPVPYSETKCAQICSHSKHTISLFPTLNWVPISVWLCCSLATLSTAKKPCNSIDLLPLFCPKIDGEKWAGNWKMAKNVDSNRPCSYDKAGLYRRDSALYGE